MGKKTVPFNASGIARLPINRPVVYKIKTDGGKNNYTGVAKRGRAQERLQEHLSNGPDPVPGSRVTIQQFSTIAEAKKQEAKIVAREKPKHNNNGK